MSSSYKIDYFSHLKNDIAESDLALILYLFGQNSHKPIIYPVHSYFSEASTVQPFKYLYEGFFPESEYICKYWEGDAKKDECHVLRLSLPAMKIGDLWEFLELIDWISTLSTENGFVGTVSAHGEEQDVKLLYVYKKRLFFGTPKKFEITAFTGEKRMENIWTE